ncbi:Fasciclin and related adhesion glycoproteins [Ceraceosorus bombacis]|uniref:Fasciclin and related adhesion glycoproteins n=1 Tax=Ceraceosorus bombacis TaxID=401625 RepID=A0A0P1BS80_9BASI|nr:Fasciclin and related adhesion glycoproteins [Ceraceosorus bombacis]
MTLLVVKQRRRFPNASFTVVISLLLCVVSSILGCAALVASPTSEHDASSSSTSYNLIDVLADSTEHTLLLRMLQRTRLLPTLNRLMEFDDGRGLTIFAPTDEAIERKRDAEQAKRLASAHSLHFQAPEQMYEDEDGVELLSPAWAYPRSAKSVWEWAVDLATHDSEQEGLSPPHPAMSGAELHLPVTGFSGTGQAWLKVDNIEAALRAQLLYHMINYTLPLDVSEGVVVARDAATFEDNKGAAQMLETLHRPSSTTLHTRPGTVPHPPSSPGSEDNGWLLGGEGQRLRMAKRAEKGEQDSLWVGTDVTGKESGAKVFNTNRNSSAGVIFSIDGVLELPPDFETLLSAHPALQHLTNLSSAALLSTLSEAPHTTFFLPNAAAFGKLSELERTFLTGATDLAAQDRVKLIGWHMSGIGVGEGRIGYAERLRKSGTNITTILGGQVPVSTASNGTVTVGNATLVEEDILIENGVVHIVDDLLLPGGTFGMNIERTLLALNCTRFVSLVHNAGLSAYIDNDIRDPDGEGTNATWTFMAPRDDVLDEWIERGAPTDGSSGAVDAEYAEQRWGVPSHLATLHLDEDHVLQAGINGTKLEELLRYHIAPGRLTPKSLQDGMLIGTELRDWKLKFGRQRVAVEVAEDPRQEKDRQGNGDVAFGDANVIAKPVEVGGSIIYLISQLLQVPLNPIQTAVSSLTLSTFVATVFSAELDKPIKRAPGITYFVPHNDAFSALGLAMNYLLLPREGPRAELRSVVEYHAVDRVVYVQDFVKGAKKYPTLEGSPIWAGQSENGTIELRRGTEGRDARVLQGDLLTSTGVLHEIDQVELPPTLDLTIRKLMTGAKAQTMMSLIEEAGYGWILNGTAPTSPEAAAELERNSAAVQGNGGKKGERKRHRKRHNLFADGGQSYVVLVPTDAAFARVNLTYYLEDREALRELVQLHIIPSPADVMLPGGTSDRLPIALSNDFGFTSLLDRSLGGASRYGKLGFRKEKHAEKNDDGGAPDLNKGLGWVVGVQGSRGNDHRQHSANVLSFGRESLSSTRADADSAQENDRGKGLLSKRRGRSRLPTPIDGQEAWNSRSIGGVLTLDAVLQPYEPGWFYSWGWIVLTVIMVGCVLTGMGFGLWRWWHRDGRIRLPDALEGEED